MTVRLGIMGGTFDPIHNVHLLKASEAAHRLGLDEVVFVPAGRPWQKDPRKVSAAEERYAMTELAVAPDPRFSASRMEIDRAGPTYAVDTLRELRRLHGPRAKLYFIAGADVLASITTWREAHSLPELAHFVFCSRQGYELTDPIPPLGTYGSEDKGEGIGESDGDPDPDRDGEGSTVRYQDHFTLLHVPVWEVSSTVIRQRVRCGQSVRHLVPDSVADYIAERGLYRAEAY
jgi:nicotinate-nucleotide adenylyltransferase